MATEPDVLSLRIVCPPPGQGPVEVRPLVGGRDLLADAYPHGIGVSPRYLPGAGAARRAAVVPST